MCASCKGCHFFDSSLSVILLRGCKIITMILGSSMQHWILENGSPKKLTKLRISDHFLPIPDVACCTFTVPWWMLSTYPHSASEIELTLSFIFCLWSEIRYRGEEVGSKKSKLNHLIICISIYQLCIVIKRVLEF